MAGAFLEIEYRDNEIPRALRALISQLNRPQPAFRDIGEYLLLSHEQRFADQESPDGDPWAPLSPRYQARKKKNPDKVLVLDGFLKDRYPVGHHHAVTVAALGKRDAFIEAKQGVFFTAAGLRQLFTGRAVSDEHVDVFQPVAKFFRQAFDSTDNK